LSSSETQPLAVEAGTQVLTFDAQAERSVSRLRVVVAVIVSLASISILLGRPGTFGVVIALLGLGASVGWAFAFRRSGRRVAERDLYFLRLDDEGVTLSLGAKVTSTPWSAVEDASVSEDRLILELRLSDGTIFDIPPMFRGYGIYDLEELVNARLGAAPTPSDG